MPKGKCEAGEARCRALSAEVDGGEELADVEVSGEERMAIEAKLKHIHCATGPGSMERRSSRLPSPTCIEWRRKDPRRQSTIAEMQLM